MLQLRPMTVIALVVCSCALGASGATLKYREKILRLEEERAGYMALAKSAVGMSDRALHFAQGYQATLDICMTRLYAPTASALVVSNKPLGKGGVGGPNSVRGDSRLP